LINFIQFLQRFKFCEDEHCYYLEFDNNARLVLESKSFYAYESDAGKLNELMDSHYDKQTTKMNIFKGFFGDIHSDNRAKQVIALKRILSDEVDIKLCFPDEIQAYSPLSDILKTAFKQLEVHGDII
jgi:hypothetical protein